MTAIYLLIDPRDRRVRYVGQTTKPRKRLDTHRNYATEPVASWVDELRQVGMVPAMRIIGRVADADALESEREAILFHRSVGSPILNVNITHRDPGHSPRTSSAVSLSLRPEDIAHLEAARLPGESASTAALRLIRGVLGIPEIRVKRGRPKVVTDGN